jgi:Cyclic nucleotide-binding domain
MRPFFSFGIFLDGRWKVIPKTKPTTPCDLKVFLTKANGEKTISAYRANSRIFAQGDPADAIFCIEKGKVKLSVVSKQGKEAVVALLGEGDFFGEGCLAGQSVRMATALTSLPGGPLPNHTERRPDQPAPVCKCFFKN